MDKSLLTAILFCTGTALAAWAPSSLDAQRQNEAAEPRRDYVLSVDGNSVVVRPGEELQLKGEFKDPRVRLDVGPVRHFAYGGIAFDYPASFVWEADIVDSFMKTWTMDGADISIMVFRTEFEFTAEEFTESLAEEFDEIEQEQIVRRFGESEFAGEQVITVIAGSTLIYEALQVPVEEGSTLLVIMDSSEGSSHSSEYAEAVGMMRETFRLVGNVDAEEVAKLEEQIAEVREQIEVFKVTYTDEQPMMKELYAELARLEAELQAARSGD